MTMYAVIMPMIYNTCTICVRFYIWHLSRFDQSILRFYWAFNGKFVAYSCDWIVVLYKIIWMTLIASHMCLDEVKQLGITAQRLSPKQYSLNPQASDHKVCVQPLKVYEATNAAKLLCPAIRYPIMQLLHLYLYRSNSTAPLKYLCCYHVVPTQPLCWSTCMGTPR